MFALVGLLFACGTAAPSPKPAVEQPDAGPHADSRLQTLIAATPKASWHYDVTRDGSGDLLVEAQIRGAASPGLHVDRPAGRYVHDLVVRSGNAWLPVEGLDAPACQQSCRLRYRFGLFAAADELADTSVADRHEDTILSPPTAWLLRPQNEDTSLVFRVAAEPSTFVTGLWPLEGVEHTYVGDSNVFWRAPYSAFGSFHQHARDIGEARVEVAIAKGGQVLNEEVVMAWLDDGMKAVTAYFGRFPVPRAMLIVLPTGGSRVHGKELGGGGASVLLWVGSEAGQAKLARDWVGVHEMVHLALPMMPYRFGWLAEGLATYVEPLARAQVGLVTDQVVWRDMLRGIPKGQPEPGDRGLARTRTWGRLYWGGAMFALVADVEIQKRTGGKMGLQDALRATIARGGHNGASWSIDEFMAACDTATGTSVMTEQYAAWSHTPVTVDLEGLWQQLGVTLSGRAVTFDDTAPLAHIRKQMTQAQ
jgi:hypothetical protein